MDGTLYLAGGGSPEDERQLWREMLENRRRVLYWPFALSGDILDSASEWLRTHLTAVRADVDVTTWVSLTDHKPSELAEFELLFVGGGNTFNLLHHVRTHGFIEPSRDFVQSGGAYYGGSAGAVLACDTIAIADGHDPNEPQLTDYSALGLIRNVSILPHYDPTQLESAQAWAARNSAQVLGVPSESGLVIDAGPARVVGASSVWTLDGHVARTHAPGSRLDVERRRPE